MYVGHDTDKPLSFGILSCSLSLAPGVSAVTVRNQVRSKLSAASVFFCRSCLCRARCSLRAQRERAQPCSLHTAAASLLAAGELTHLRGATCLRYCCRNSNRLYRYSYPA